MAEGPASCSGVSRWPSADIATDGSVAGCFVASCRLLLFAFPAEAVPLVLELVMFASALQTSHYDQKVVHKRCQCSVRDGMVVDSEFTAEPVRTGE